MMERIPDNAYKNILEYSIICAVDAVIVNDKKVLLAKRKQEPAKGQWWIPGGRQNKGELPKDAVVTKIKQETGLDIKVEKLILVDDVIFDKTAFEEVKTGVHYSAKVYLVTLIDPKQIPKLDETQEKYRWIDKEWFEDNKRDLQEYVIKSIENSGVFN